MVVNSVKASEDLMIKNKAEMIEMLASKEWKKFELFIFENFRNCNNEELTRYNISVLSEIIQDKITVSRIKANIEASISHFNSFSSVSIATGALTTLITISGNLIFSLSGIDWLGIYPMLVLWIIFGIQITYYYSFYRGVMVSAKYLSVLIKGLETK